MQNNHARFELNQDEREQHPCFSVHQVTTPSGQGDCDKSSIRVFEKELAAQSHRDWTSCSRNAQECFSSLIISIAKQNNLYLSPDDCNNLGELLLIRSGESQVYENTAQGLIYKVRDPFAKLHLKSQRLEDVLYEHIVHNVLFPTAHYNFIGISESIDTLRIVYSQKLFYNLNTPTQEQIDNYLASLGLIKNGYYYENDFIAITDVSAQSDNVLLDDSNNLIFIDPIIKLKKPANEVLEHLSNVSSDIPQMPNKRHSFFRRIFNLFK